MNNCFWTNELINSRDSDFDKEISDRLDFIYETPFSWRSFFSYNKKADYQMGFSMDGNNDRLSTIKKATFL